MEIGKKRICWIRVLKNICYFVAPVLVMALVLSIVSVFYVYEAGIANKEENYFDTTKFAEEYLYSIDNITSKIKNIEAEENETLKQKYRYSYGYYEEQTTKIGKKDMRIMYQQYSNNFMYLVIDNKNNVIYVNGDYGVSSHTTIDNLKEEILSNKLYWTYENGEINTTIDKISKERLENTTFYHDELQEMRYTIYTGIRDNLPYYDSYVTDSIIYTVVKNQYDYAIYNIPLTVILLIVMIPIVLIGIGKTRDEDKIHLTWFDKLPIEVSIGLLVLIDFCGCGLTFGIGLNIAAIISIISIGIGLIILYISAVLLLETVVKRLKTHTFIKTTIAYWLYNKIKLVLRNMKISFRLGIIFVVFLIANCIIFDMFDREAFIAFILLIALYATSFIYVLKRIMWYKSIKESIEQIYKGNTNVRLDEEEFKGDLKKLAIQVNDIAGGFSNAVEEQLKSERLKTELITNVSHDIKTPLTSIINYVDLLKKEEITDEKATEYLAILDNKSQRLKKLTEDLIEASKASSGNIKLTMEKLEINELIKQVSAEFEDKFKLRGLDEIITFTQDQMYIKADSRYMYRVLENMYSNVSKYAMENSRVYTDIIEKGNNVIIQIKNISKDKLNITVDELMQRFVRGDTSRNTEGSGLGLSIANSLTELQGGKFDIYLDGDLFKITIEFKKMT